MEKVWTFRYKRNPEPAASAQVSAVDEREAVAVAAEWCRQQGERVRFFGAVMPFIVADASILAGVPGVSASVPARPVDTSAEASEAQRAVFGGG